MPLIYRVACDACSFQRENELWITVVEVGGKEEICPHPTEQSTAEQVTGRPWDELVADDRIRHQDALICVSCGQLDFYGSGPPRCSRCDTASLLPLTGPFDGVRCPECGRGQLTSAITAIS